MACPWFCLLNGAYCIAVALHGFACCNKHLVTPAPTLSKAGQELLNLRQLRADNITLVSDYYARRTLACTIGERDPLLAALLDAQQSDKRKVPEQSGDA